MSETDDTDVLLLIPPNFFSVHSSGSEDSLLDSSRTVVHRPSSCTAQVLGKLVNQVHSLENRLDSLELTSDCTQSVSSYGRSRHKTWDFSASVDSVSVTKFSTFPRRRRRKTALQRERRQDLSLTSIDSEDYRSRIPPLSLKKQSDLTSAASAIDDICSMDGDISSIVSTPNKKNDKLLLHEIDEFLTKVESYELPESKQRLVESTLSPENVIKATGDYISQKIDSSNIDDVKLPSGRMVPSSILDKYIYLVRNNAVSLQSAKPATSNFISQNTEGVNEDTPKKAEDIKQEKSPSIRRLNFHENKDIQPTSTPKRTEVSSSFRPSTNKIYERASKVLEQYKQNCTNVSVDTSYAASQKKDQFKVPQNPKPYTYGHVDKELRPSLLQSKLMDTIDTELLSLSDLWGEKREDKVDSVRLEEERLKREHCEFLIQDLQKKLLEQQEKLAVAVRVDRSKDAAIAKLRESWVRLTSGLERTEERHNADLEKMKNDVEGWRAAADEAKKKAQHFEKELYKALDLAHDYQEKCKKLTLANSELKESTEKSLLDKDEVIQGKAKEIEVLRENYETVMRLNKQSTDCIKNADEALEKERNEHEKTKLKLVDFARQLQSAQEECDVTKRERDGLKTKAAVCEKQLAEKQNQCSELLRKCDTLEEQTKLLTSQLEMQKQSLKQHYQSQLESAVVAKLREFQLQLEMAERGMEAEWRSKEQALREATGKQLEAISEQHKLEIKVLEEKHREETKLHRLQLAQASEKISTLESKVSWQRARRGRMAEQLHGVMQAQWRQALHILTGRSAAHNASDIVVSTPDGQDYSKIPPLSLPPLGSLRRDNEPFLNLDGLSDSELQQYVKLLLTKPPNLNASGDAPFSDLETHKDMMEEPTSDRNDKADKRDKGKRSLNANKPPWKS